MTGIWNKLKELGVSDDNELLKLCQGLTLFDDLNHYEMKFFLRDVVLRTYQNDEVVFEMGKPAVATYVILSGSVGLYRQSPDVLLERIRYLKRGDCFGEEALLGLKLRSCAAQSQEETRVIAIIASDFEKLANRKPRIAGKILHALARILYANLRAAEDEMQTLTHRLTEANIIV